MWQPWPIKKPPYSAVFLLLHCHTPPTRKIVEASKAQPKAETKQTEVEATTIQAETEAGPSVPTETEPVVVKEKATEQIASEKVETSAPEA